MFVAFVTNGLQLHNFVKLNKDSALILLMKVAFFTPRKINPLHPRLVAFNRYFKLKGIQVDFVNASNYKPNLISKLNWLSLWFFDFHAIQLCKPSVQKFDIVFVTDLKYLPLAKYAQRLNKIVIYDTIDHNVYLRFYQLENKIRVIKPFKNIIIPFFKKIEKHYAFKYCHSILVNSRALRAYFNNRANVLFYSSPFEDINHGNHSDYPTALLYLGIFSPEKGAHEIIKIQHRLGIPLFIYGDISSPTLEKEIAKNLDIHHTKKISVEALKAELTKLLSQYYLAGFSLIKPAHHSYEVQEANKDIDYLALGIPLIGNERLTTKEKIEAGCGIFHDDVRLSEKINTPSTKQSMASTCRTYYYQNYHSKLFDQALDVALEKYLNNGYH
jgi:glycosyltransferase involved in cell wall biosynthesis